MMGRCQSCSVCRRRCPTGAIRTEEFVIDAGRCVTLYNEIDCEFPQWMPATAHNALIGCMRCQELCPMNIDVVSLSGTMEDITEEETTRILEGKPDDALLESLTRKLMGFYPAGSRERFPIFTRNLEVLVG
jgi:epoxyqueuosine reductase